MKIRLETVNPTTAFMKNLPFILLLFLVACSESEPATQIPDTPPEPKPVIALEGFGQYFSSDSLIGHFSLYNLNADQWSVYNDSVQDQFFPPASTFKIFNSMVGLETGVIGDTSQVRKWDGRDRGWRQWNRDHNMRSAFKYSALWFYREVAREVMAKDSNAYQNYLTEAQFGNQQLTEGSDMFWLDNSLQITPRQQIEFLVKFYREDLPFSTRHIQATKDAMVLEKGEQFILYGKTGTARIGEEDLVGWQIGFVERDSNVYFYTTNIQNLKPFPTIGDFRDKYLGATQQILTDMALIN